MSCLIRKKLKFLSAKDSVCCIANRLKSAVTTRMVFWRLVLLLHFTFVMANGTEGRIHLWNRIHSPLKAATKNH